MKTYNNFCTRLLTRITPNLFTKPLGSGPWGDLNGAVAGSLASLPQTLAFGLIIGGAMGGSSSGVGVLIALYGSVLLGLSAAIFGGCPFLVAGPRASTLLVFAALIIQLTQSAAFSHLPDATSVALILACTAVVGAGVLQFFYGLFQLGRLTNYVPFPVMSGFVNASALLIILSQVCPAMGITEQKSLWNFFGHINEIKPATLLLSFTTAALVIFLPRLTKRVPPVPFAFIVGTSIYHLLAALGFGDALGGTIPPPPEHYTLHFIGSDAFAILSSQFGGEIIPPLLAATLSMSILSSLDTLFATAATDEITMSRSNTGRQLMAEGFGNMLAGMFGMAPGSGALARTKAALSGGMRSTLAPVGIALITLVVALVMSPLIGLMSHAVMAGLLIALGLDLIDKWTLTRLRRLFFAHHGTAAVGSDMMVVLVVVSTALIADLTTAVGMGVLLSVLLFVTQMARNPVRRGYHATALIPRIYGDIARQRSLEHYGNSIAILEIEGILFFGTVAELESRVVEFMNQGIVHVVLDMRRLKHIDATGARALERISSRLSQLGGILVVGHVDRERRKFRDRLVGEEKRGQSVPRNIWAKLADFGTISAIGNDRFLIDTDSAVAMCEKHLAAKFSGAPASHELGAAHSPLMRNLDRHMLRRLRRCLSRVSFKQGDVVVMQGSSPDGAYFVASGRVDVMIDLPGTERKRKVQSLASGSVFGEMALIDPNPRSATIIAVEPTMCYCMSSQTFERLKTEQPDIVFALLAAATMIFAERLRATNKMLAEMEA